MQLRSVKQQLANRLGCSIAEVDHHDVWQRARLTLACVTREAGDASRLLDEAERWLSGQAFELGCASANSCTSRTGMADVRPSTCTIVCACVSWVA